jgi:hypothetical protein
VEQVKEKTASIQALVHSTVGQTLPVRAQSWGGEPGQPLQPGLPASLCFSSDPFEEAFSLHHQYHVATAFLRIWRELHPGMGDER